MSIPGSMMSQKSAMPACHTTSKLKRAAINKPANRPHAMERTLVANNPISAPAINPFSMET